jgi:hypothetical protein
MADGRVAAWRGVDRAGVLTAAAAMFVAGNLIHTADHLRQGTGRLTTEVLAGGTVLTLAAFAALWLAWRHHAHAAAFAAVVGVTGAVGISAAHLLPHWSALSDSYPDIGVDALSWAIVLIEIATATGLAVVAIRTARATA